MRDPFASFVIFLLGIIFFAIGVGLDCSIYWGNPDMTEQRLFIEFYPQILGATALQIIGSVMVIWRIVT